MARSEQRSPTSETGQQLAQAPEATTSEPVPPLLSENVLNQIVGMVLRRANVQSAAAADTPGTQADVLAALAQVLRPPPLGPEAMAAIARYQVLAAALTHE